MARTITCAAVALVSTGFLAAPIFAADILKTNVDHEDGRYRVSFEVRIDADGAVVRRLLTDFARFNRLSEGIIESEVLQTYADGKQRVRIVMRACVLFMCRTVTKTANIEIRDSGDVLSMADPAESDFRLAEEHWQILPADSGTLLRYQAELVPSFSVPPLIGPWLVKYHIRRELETVCRKIEQLDKDEAR
jgi:hypothetical protein